MHSNSSLAVLPHSSPSLPLALVRLWVLSWGPDEAVTHIWARHYCHCVPLTATSKGLVNSVCIKRFSWGPDCGIHARKHSLGGSARPHYLQTAGQHHKSEVININTSAGRPSELRSDALWKPPIIVDWQQSLRSVFLWGVVEASCSQRAAYLHADVNISQLCPDHVNCAQEGFSETSTEKGLWVTLRWPNQFHTRLSFKKIFLN